MNVRVRIHSLLALLMLANLLLVPADAVAHERVTNLDHIDFLTASVDPPDQAGHTTYQLEQDPSIGVL